MFISKFTSMGMTHRESVDAVEDGGELCWRNAIQHARKGLAFEREKPLIGGIKESIGLSTR